jgi:hypothetical protein
MSFENTLNYSDYTKYKKLKESLCLNYKGIDLSKVIAWNLLGIIVYGSKANFRDLILLPFLKVDPVKFLVAFGQNDSVFSTIYNSRNDHKELLIKICSTVKNSNIIEINPHSISFRINLRNSRKIFTRILQNKLLKEYGVFNRLYLALVALYICNQIDNFENVFRNIDLKNKKYIPFLSSVGVEAALTQFFANKGVTTFHIFHGIFGRYIRLIANDIINGENITSSKILAFSESTKGDLVRDFGYNPSDIYIAGNPKYPSKKISIKTTFKKCIVLNGFSFYDKDFLNLLYLLNDISKEAKIQFEIKPHPTSKILSLINHTNYSNLHFIQNRMTLNELLYNESYDFAIAYNTVTYYECMYYNLICLRYGSNENLNFEGLNDKFYDKASFYSKLQYIKESNITTINNNISNLLVRTLGMGINRYDKYINNALNIFNHDV